MPIVGALPEWSFLEGVTVKVAVAHTLGNAQKVIDAIKDGTAQYHFVEVMTCPGGCIGGGGQPRLTTNAVREARIAAIYREDEGRELRKSHENPAVLELYREYLGGAGGDEGPPPPAHRLRRKGARLARRGGVVSWRAVDDRKVVDRPPTPTAGDTPWQTSDSS